MVCTRCRKASGIGTNSTVHERFLRHQCTGLCARPAISFFDFSNGHVTRLFELETAVCSARNVVRLKNSVPADWMMAVHKPGKNSEIGATFLLGFAQQYRFGGGV